MSANAKQPLKFSKFLESEWLTDAKDFKLKKPTIVVNISNMDAIISGSPPRKVLQPRKSTILQGNCKCANAHYVAGYFAPSSVHYYFQL